MLKNKALSHDEKIQECLKTVHGIIDSLGKEQVEKLKREILFLLETMQTQGANEICSAPDTESVYFGGSVSQGIPVIYEEAKSIIKLILNSFE